MAQSEELRRQSILAGLPYMRQIVRYRGELFTIMAYNFLNPPQVQLAPGIRNTALGWDTEAADWVSWTKCEISREDAAWLKEYRQDEESPKAPKPITKHQDDIKRGLRPKEGRGTK